ncbi:unnamed protein product [Psylliodes chrysocephalus]|uniref:Uncharacterized protein n=1 Tax=Psylliodes chrysocephalus TaxID=3402493 RepID=A0A9P0D2X0_9CUCU|nr:unnamed protein product [Psylliodes chrysocephala]
MLEVHNRLGGAICSTKLEELLGDIEQFDLNNKRNEYLRINSRLAHVHRRLEFIFPPDKLVKDKEHLMDLSKDLVYNIEQINAPKTVDIVNDDVSNSSILDIPVNELSEFLDNIDVNKDKGGSTPKQNVDF